MINVRGSLIGVPTFVLRDDGAQGVNFAVGSDTIFAFLALPQSAVSPLPTVSMFRGDPRRIALQLSEVSNGLLFESEDTSKLDQGDYKVIYSRFPLVLYSYVHVQPNMAVARSVWDAVYSQPSGDELIISRPQVGDRALITRNGDGGLVRAYGQVKNVIVSVTLDGGRSQPTADVAAAFLRVMVNHVNTQAR
jgi:hypothetical protein